MSINESRFPSVRTTARKSYDPLAIIPNIHLPLIFLPFSPFALPNWLSSTCTLILRPPIRSLSHAERRWSLTRLPNALQMAHIVRDDVMIGFPLPDFDSPRLVSKNILRYVSPWAQWYITINIRFGGSFLRAKKLSDRRPLFPPGLHLLEHRNMLARLCCEARTMSRWQTGHSHRFRISPIDCRYVSAFCLSPASLNNSLRFMLNTIDSGNVIHEKRRYLLSYIRLYIVVAGFYRIAHFLTTACPHSMETTWNSPHFYLVHWKPAKNYIIGATNFVHFNVRASAAYVESFRTKCKANRIPLLQPENFYS